MIGMVYSAAVALSAAPASGRDSADETPASSPRDAWTIRFEPMVWAPALRGDFKLPASARVDVEAVGADENEIIPAGRFTMRAGEWSIQFRGFGFSLDELGTASEDLTIGGAALGAGDRVRTSIDLAGFDLTAGRAVWTPLEDTEADVRIAFDLYAGARLHSVEASVRPEGGGASSRSDNVWAEPIVGGRMTLDLPHGFGVNVSMDAGGLPLGDDSSFSWDITVAFSWMMHDKAGVEIGFRHLQMDLSEGSGADEFEFDAALAGLFGAVVFRF